MKRLKHFKLWLLALLLVAGGASAWGQVKTYTLIKSNDDLVAGSKYLIVGLNSGNGYALGSQSTNNRAGASVAISSSSISIMPATAPTDANPYEITLGGTTGTWTLYDAVNSTYLRPRTGNNNGLQGNAVSQNWTISINETGVATMKCENTTTYPRNILRFNYNNGSPIFASYASGQTDVYLYDVYLYKEVIDEDCIEADFLFDEDEISKLTTDAPFKNDFISDNESDMVWTSSNTAVATVDEDGLVTIEGAGTTNITVTQVADGNYCAVNASYTLNVTAPVYTVTPSTNNASFGTVTIADNIISATPEAGYRVSLTDPYTITDGTATVTQNGNEFTVTPESDCAVQINFEAAPTYTVSFDAGSGEYTGGDITEAQGGVGITLPNATPPCLDWSFVGWATDEISETTTVPELYVYGDTYYPVSNTTLYAVYSKTVAGGGPATLVMSYSSNNGWDVTNTEDKNSYFLLNSGKYILSPSFDLSDIISITVTIRTFGGAAYNTLSIQDEFDNVWGTAIAGSSTLTEKTANKTGSLSGIGKLKLLSTTTSAANGVGISNITITYNSSTTTYNSNPSCEEEPPIVAPSAHVTDFDAVEDGENSIILSWEDSDAEGYLIKASAVSCEDIVDPIDGTPENDGPLVKNIAVGEEIVEFEGLIAGTQYFFKIFPYNGSGINIKYLIDGAPCESATTEEPAPLEMPAVIITEVYGGGGNSGATLKNDFIELFNTTDSPVDISGWSVQYYSGTGINPTANTGTFVFGENSVIPAKSYYLVQAAAGNGGTVDLFEPDAVSEIAAAAANGKIILFSSDESQTVVANDISSVTGNDYFIDYVPYGTATPQWGDALGALSNTTSAIRKKDGSGNFLYTGNIGNDFEVDTPEPQNMGVYRSKADATLSAFANWEYTDNGTWADATELNTGRKFIVAAGHELTVAGDAAPASVKVAPTAKLTIESGIFAPRALTLQSDANGTATLVGNYAGEATVEQVLGDRSWYMGVPVKDGTISGDILSGSDANVGFHTYNGDGTWGKATDLPDAGYGILVYPDEAGTVSFTGQLHNDDVSPTLTPDDRRYTYLGNPYPSYLVWGESVYGGDDVLETIWFRTKQGEDQYVFATYTSGGEGAMDADANIAPMQGFWVRVVEEATDTEFIFDNSERMHKPDGVEAGLRAPKAEYPVLRLEVNDGTLRDEAVIYFKDENSNDRDRFDAAKMMNKNRVPEIWTTVSGEATVINAMKEVPYNEEMALGFNTNKTGDFTIKAVTFKGFEEGVSVQLTDKVAGVTTILSVEDYSFSSDVANTNNRFVIKFVPGSTTGIENQIEGLNIYTRNNELVVNLNNSEQARATVYSVSGQQLASRTLTPGSTVVAEGLSQGIYLVIVENGADRAVQRVIVK